MFVNKVRKKVIHFIAKARWLNVNWQLWFRRPNLVSFHSEHVKVLISVKQFCEANAIWISLWSREHCSISCESSLPVLPSMLAAADDILSWQDSTVFSFANIKKQNNWKKKNLRKVIYMKTYNMPTRKIKRYLLIGK